MADIADIGFRVDTSGLERANALLGQIGRADGPVRRSAQQMGQAFNRVRSSVLSLQGAIAALGVGIGLSSAIRTVSEFESAIAGVAAVTRATTQEMELMEKQARELGATTVFSARQAASGMEFLGRAGFNTQQIMAAMPGTLDLAAAASLDLGRAADIASNVIQAFGLEAAEMGRVSDVLAGAAVRANTDVSQLADALKFAAPIAAGFGVSVEEATAAIGTLSNAGLQATLAGTGLRRVMTELANPSDDLRRFMGGLTLEADGLNAVMEQLSSSTIDTSLALEIFGDRGGPAFTVLKSGAFATKELTADLRELEGEARRLAEERLGAMEFAMRTLVSATEELVLVMGEEGLSQAVQDVANSLTEFARSEDAIKLANNLGDATKALGDALLFLGENITTVGTAMGALIGLKMGAILGPWGALAGAAIGAAAAFSQLSDDTERVVDLLERLDRELQGSEVSTALREQGEAALEAALADREALAASIAIREEMIKRRNADRELIPGLVGRDRANTPRIDVIELQRLQALQIANEGRIATIQGSLFADALGQGFEGRSPIAPSDDDINNAVKLTDAMKRAIQIGVEGVEVQEEWASAMGDNLRASLDVEESYRRTVEGIKLSTSLLSLDEDTRERILFIERQKLAAQAQGVELTEQQIANLDDLLRKQQEEQDRVEEVEEARKRATEEAEARAEELSKPFERAADNIQDAFADTLTDIFDKGVSSFSDLADRMKSIFFRMLAELAAAAVIRPIIQPVVAAAIGGAGAATGAAASPAAASLFSGGSGGGISQNVFSLAQSLGGDLFGTGGIGGGLNAFGANLGFSSGAPAILPGAAGAAGPGGTVPAAGSIFGTTTFTQFLGGVGAGFAAGSLLNGLVGGNPVGGTIGSGIGSLGGAAIGSLFGGPLIGGLIGGAAGGLFGGLFGGGDPNVNSSGALVADASGGLSGIFSDAQAGGSAETGTAVAQALANTLIALDAEVAPQFRGQNLARVGFTGTGGNTAFLKSQQAGVVDGRNVVKFGQGEAGLSQAFERFINDALSTGVISVSDENRRLIELAATGTGDFVENLEELISRSQQFNAGLEALARSQEDVNEAERALEAIGEAFDELASEAEFLGRSLSEVEAARQKAITDFTEGFVTSIQDQLLAFEDPLALQLRQLERAQEERIEAAEALGVSLVEIERLNALERARVVEQFGSQANDTLEAILISQQASSSSPLPLSESLGNAQARFDQLLGQAAGGDAAAREDLGGAANNLLDLLRDRFASSSEFFSRRDTVLSGIASVLDGGSGGSGAESNSLLQAIGIEITQGNDVSTQILEAIQGLVASQNRLNRRLESLEARA